MPTVAVAYLRVSTERQASEEKTSLADQRAAIEQLAVRLGADVVTWFTDPGASGATAEKRPGFMALLEHCSANRRRKEAPGQVLVLNDSRFGRFDDPEEAAYWRHHLRRLGWIVRFAEGDETEDRTARTVLRAIHSSQATAYREAVRQNAKRGARSTVEAGYWRTRAPFGYRRIVAYPAGAARVLEDGQHKAPNEKVKLTPHADEAAVVRWMFDAYASGGESLNSIVEGLQRRAPVRRWCRTVVGVMLRNPAYRGAIVGGRKSGESYGVEGAHEAIVPAEVWHEVQRRLGLNVAAGHGARGTPYLLTGIMRCVYCGEAYGGGGGGRSRNANPVRSHRRFYRDAGGVNGLCPGRIGTVFRHLVDDKAVELLAETIESPAARREIERALDEALDRGPVSENDTQLKAAIRKQEQRRVHLVDAIADGALLQVEAAPKLEQIRASIAELEAKRQARRFAGQRAKVARSVRDQLMSVAMDFGAIASRLTGAALRRHVEPWLGSVTFDKVTRELSLGIRPIPFVPSLALHTSPESAGREKARLIVRDASLLQPGHDYRIADAEEAMRAAGGE